MISPVVFWPSALGLAVFAAGICTYRRDLLATPSSSGLRFLALGPVFVAAALATFAGEHFTAARGLAQLVPKWMPDRLFIAYFVGVALLAAALSLVAKRCVRWSALGLAIMFALFVLMLHLPNAVSHARQRIFWIVAVRESVFATGAWFLFASQATGPASPRAGKLAVGRAWVAIVVIFYGIEHLLHPECSPGVPSLKLTASWFPFPLAASYITGIVLVLLGMAMLLNKYAQLSAGMVGLVMTVLTVALYFPDFFVVRGVSDQVTAINYIADTLLFAGTMLLVARVLA